jgi:predicted nuclease of predicted toxin-antitoxin system
MKLLLDECCEPRLAATLRAAGHDVYYVLEADPGAADEAILSLSRAQGRILVTGDRDFGELAIRQGQSVPGLILLRLTPRQNERAPGPAR